jgi:UPF0271 protein
MPIPNDSPQTIDLNCDVGEGTGQDALLIPLVSSVNIACGGHAGSHALMRDTVALAAHHGVAVGAHPGHRDREHFGRRQLAVGPSEAARVVVEQLDEFTQVTDTCFDHVKLHGGLYHQVAHDQRLAEAVCQALADHWPAAKLVLPVASVAIERAVAHGLIVTREAFLDRAYTDEGGLLPRSEPGSVLCDAAAVAQRAVQLVQHGQVIAASGQLLSLTSDTLCVHGDSPSAFQLLQQIRAAFTAAGIRVARHSGID